MQAYETEMMNLPRNLTHCLGHGILLLLIYFQAISATYVFFFVQKACGFLVPQPGIEPTPLAMKVWNPH